MCNSLLLEISRLSTSESHIVDELLGTLRERDGLDEQIRNGLVLSSNDQIELILDDLFHVEEFPVVEVLSELQSQIRVHVSEFRRSSAQIGKDLEDFKSRVHMGTAYIIKANR